MDENLIFYKNDIGELIIKDDVQLCLKTNGFTACSCEFIEQLMRESLELAKLKAEMKHKGNREYVNIK